MFPSYRNQSVDLLCLSRPYPLKLLTAVFHKIYLVHSWILYLISGILPGDTHDIITVLIRNNRQLDWYSLIHLPNKKMKDIINRTSSCNLCICIASWFSLETNCSCCVTNCCSTFFACDITDVTDLCSNCILSSAFETRAILKKKKHFSTFHIVRVIGIETYDFFHISYMWRLAHSYQNWVDGNWN